MVGLRTDGFNYFVVFYFSAILVVLAVEGLTLAVSIGTKDTEQAGAIVPVFLIINVLFSGYLIPNDQIPPGLAWLKYIRLICLVYTIN